MISFSDALRAVKDGRRIQRAGWNGKGMHVYLEDWCEAGPTLQGRVYGRVYLPTLVLFNAQGHHQPGWLPSQADLLADDWSVIE